VENVSWREDCLGGTFLQWNITQVKDSSEQCCLEASESLASLALEHLQLSGLFAVSRSVHICIVAHPSRQSYPVTHLLRVCSD
jgi:hypothetical protein